MRSIADRVAQLTLTSAASRAVAGVVGRSVLDQWEYGGVLVGTITGARARATRLFECHNLATDNRAFELGLDEFDRVTAQARAFRLRALAIIHTHPSGIMHQSASDMDLPRITGLMAVIAGRAPSRRPCANCYGIRRGVLVPVRLSIEW